MAWTNINNINPSTQVYNQETATPGDIITEDTGITIMTPDQSYAPGDNVTIGSIVAISTTEYADRGNIYFTKVAANMGSDQLAGVVIKGILNTDIDIKDAAYRVGEYATDIPILRYGRAVVGLAEDVSSGVPILVGSKVYVAPDTGFVTNKNDVIQNAILTEWSFAGIAGFSGMGISNETFPYGFAWVNINPATF